MKQRLSLGLVLVASAALLNGCAPSDSGPSFGNVGRNFADDWTGARAFDNASVDLAHGDLKAVEEAGRALDARIQGGSRTSLNVALAWMTARLPEASISDTIAQYSPPGIGRDQARRDANRSYRAALAFLPGDPKKWRGVEAQTLNALGYFLAERGRDRADFERAEKLTALSLELWPARDSAQRTARALGPGDSHAWALFRQGRTAQALQAQMEVMQAAGEESKKYGAPPAGVIYHWGAICRVAGREDAAREAFEFALRQNPSPELREILEANLSGTLV